MKNSESSYPWFIYSHPLEKHEDSDEEDSKQRKRSWLTHIPFSARSSILLLGEGNFSFSASLIKQLSGMGYSNLFYATCLESKKDLFEKYPEAENNIAMILKHNGKVLFNVDATKVGEDRRINSQRWTRIIFQFPHLGTGIKDQSHNIYHHQKFLISAFQSISKLFHSCNATRSLTWNLSSKKYPPNTSTRPVIGDIEIHDVNERPELHLTLKTGLPYDKWEIKKLAKASFQFFVSFPFIPAIYYPDYRHVNTNASKGNQDHLSNKSCITSVFIPKTSVPKK